MGPLARPAFCHLPQPVWLQGCWGATPAHAASGNGELEVTIHMLVLIIAARIYGKLPLGHAPHASSLLHLTVSSSKQPP